MGKRALRIVLEDRPVAYHPVLARVLGSAAAGIWLSQLLFFDSVKHKTAADKGIDYDGWFYESERQLSDDTGLSRWECQAAKARAKELGIVQVELRGMPRVSHYRVDFDVLERLIGEQSSCRIPATSCRIPASKLQDSSQQVAGFQPASCRIPANMSRVRPSQFETDITQTSTEISTQTSTPSAVDAEKPKAKSNAHCSKSRELLKEMGVKGSMLDHLSERVSPEIACQWLNWLPGAQKDNPVGFMISLLRENPVALPPRNGNGHSTRKGEGAPDRSVGLTVAETLAKQRARGARFASDEPPVAVAS